MAANAGSADSRIDPFEIREDVLPGQRKDKLSLVLVRQIVHDIVSRDLPAGHALESETEMLQRYQVGRASLREALRVLEVQGLIRIRPGPGGGPTVNRVDASDFGRMSTLFFQMNRAHYSELIEARLYMEPLAAGLAARARSDEDAERLATLMEQSADIVVNDDDRWVQTANAFHTAVAAMAGNRVLYLITGSLREIYRDRVVRRPIVPVEGRRAVHEAHAAIAEAITVGDAATAETRMREHMEVVAEEITRTYPGVLDEVIDWR